MKKFIIIALAFITLGIAAGCGHKEASGIAMPASASDLEGKNYKTVVAQLKDAGFKNVKTIRDADLLVALLHQDGDVETVSVNGETDFEKHDSFAKTAKIKVTYHTFAKKDKADKKDDSASSSTESKAAESTSADSSSSSAASSSTTDTSADSSSASAKEEKTSYVLTSRREKGKIYLTGSTTLIGQNGADAVSVGVTNDASGLKAGTYTVKWTPGLLNGSDPDYAYGFVIINDDLNKGYGLNEGDVETITLKLGDSVMFKFFGKGDADRIWLDQK